MSARLALRTAPVLSSLAVVAFMGGAAAGSFAARGATPGSHGAARGGFHR